MKTAIQLINLGFCIIVIVFLTSYILRIYTTNNGKNIPVIEGFDYTDILVIREYIVSFSNT